MVILLQSRTQNRLSQLGSNQVLQILRLLLKLQSLSVLFSLVRTKYTCRYSNESTPPSAAWSECTWAVLLLAPLSVLTLNSLILFPPYCVVIFVAFLDLGLNQNPKAKHSQTPRCSKPDPHFVLQTQLYFSS